MPVLPSGRRVEYSLDRFHAMLRRMDPAEAQKLVAALQEPNDLLLVADVVEFSPHTGTAYFSGHIAADFESYVAGWTFEDQDALAAWIESETATFHRGEAIAAIHAMVREMSSAPPALLLEAA